MDKQAHSTKHLALDQPHLSIMRSNMKVPNYGTSMVMGIIVPDTYAGKPK